MAFRVLRRLRPGDSSFSYVIFPPAGGSCSTCKPLAHAEAMGEVWGVEYPGRGVRVDLPPADSLLALAAEAGAELPQAVGEHRLPQTVLVGISMGGFVAFEAARRLARPPAAVVVVGVGAPSHGRRRDTTRTDAELLELIEDNRLLDTAQLREHPEILAYALRTLRADLRMTSAYTGSEAGRVPCDLVVMYGADDPRLSEASAESWRVWAGDRFAIRVLPGSHLDLLTAGGSRTFWKTLADLGDDGFEVAEPGNVPAVARRSSS
jgi:surfactin synthase thioesterase subunit